MTQLRRIVESDIDILEQHLNDPGLAGAHSNYGFMPNDKIRREYDEHLLLQDDRGRLAIAADDGSLLGEISWFPRSHGPGPANFCWMIGIMLLPEARRKGHGSEAQRLMAAYLFDHTTVERIEASTGIDNLPEQRALEKAGFTREAVLRRAQWRQGAWRDEVLYSKLRGEE